MALVAISNLTKISPLSGNSVFPIVQDGTTYSAEVSSVNNLNTLQSVTDVGNTTTNSILIASLTAVGKIIGGNNNTANGADAAVLGGGDNTASGGSSTVTGGRCNTACADHSAILGGTTNTILSAHTDSFIIGSNITSSASATTFVNNLDVEDTITTTTLSATTIHAVSSFVEYIDIKQFELSGFDVTGNVSISGNMNVTGNITLSGDLNIDGLVDGRDIAADGAAIDNLELDVTFLSGSVDNLDFNAVTTVGNTTTNGIRVASLTTTTLSATTIHASDIQNIATVVTGLVSSGDNSATIQAVIDLVAARGGGDVVIPAGIWEIASTLVISTSNVRLRGQGAGDRNDQGLSSDEAATTLKWIGTEFDGAVVISGSLDGAGAGVTKNGTRLGTVNGFATSDVAKYQGMLIEHVSSGVYDLIMGSDDGYVEIKADSNAAWADSQSFKLYKPSVMVEVKSVYGDGTSADKQSMYSGVSKIHFDCKLAHIGLRVIAASRGEFNDLTFREPKTAAIYMGVKNIGSQDKPASPSTDPQFNNFERVVSRNFADGEYGGLLVCTGLIQPWTSNTSFNRFSDFRAFYSKGDAFILGSSDANQFNNMLCLRSTATPTGHSLKLLGSNISTEDVPRGNQFTQFSSSGGGQILCYGTDGGSSGNVNDVDIYQHPSHDNHFPMLNVGNGTPFPQIGFEADAYADTELGHRYYGKESQLVVGTNPTNLDDARANVTTESLRIVNTGANHMVLQGTGTTDWKLRVSGEDLRIGGSIGNAELKLDNRTSFAAGIATKISTVNTTAINWWYHTYVFKGLSADITANLSAGNLLMTGQEVVIKNGDPTWDVILNSNGKLVDSYPTVTTPITLTPTQFITLQWDGTEWWIIGRG